MEDVYSTFKFTSEDGTQLLGWTNNGTGPTLVVCNGLGVPPEAWPRLLDPECGYTVYGFNHRGSLGSDRPADLSRIRLEDHVADTFALMDVCEIDDALFVAWSYGVNVSFAVAAQAPERVAGMVMVAGVPGGTAEAAFAPFMVPKPLRRHVGKALSFAGELFGPELTAMAQLMPKNKMSAEFMRHTGLIMPSAKAEDMVPWMEAFSRHDFGWYFHLFPESTDHARLDTSFLEVPITVAAGAMDTLTSMREVVAFAEEIEHAQIHVLPGTHFVPLEFPDEIMSMIDGVLLDSRLADEQVHEQRKAIVDLRRVGGHNFYEHNHPHTEEAG